MNQQAPAQSRKIRLRHLRVVSRHDAITVTWLAMAVVLPFVHLKFGTGVIDPFIAVSRPMPANYYAYGLFGGLGDICFAVFAYRGIKEELKIFAWLWMVYCICDLCLFFWCNNDKSYYYLPYMVMLFITWKLFRQ
jgi:hypothetical protein